MTATFRTDEIFRYNGDPLIPISEFTSGVVGAASRFGPHKMGVAVRLAIAAIGAIRIPMGKFDA